MHWTNQNWAKSDIIEYNWDKTGQKTKKKTGRKTRQKAGQTDKNQKATYKTAAELAVKNKRSFNSFVNYQSFVVHQKSALCFLMFTFCWGNKPLIGQSTKTFSVFEELKTKQILDMGKFNQKEILLQKIIWHTFHWHICVK